MTHIRVAGAQLNLVVGDIDANAAKIVEAMSWAEDQQAAVLLLPELAITGYPPEDLVLREGFVDANLQALGEVAAHSRKVVTVVGFVDRAIDPRTDVLDDAVPRQTANAAALLTEGRVAGVYHKVLLPNYGVFDEDRYFVPGAAAGRVWPVAGLEVGVSVCEDMWVANGPPAAQAAAGARLLLNINASPYHHGKGRERGALLAHHARTSGVPVVYLNLVGGQDELVFDGESMVFSAEGTLLYRAAQFEEERFVVDLDLEGNGATPAEPVRPRLAEPAELYAALRLGLADYARKNGFSELLVGLSGGIDSALTAAIACDAVGPERVWGVAMPTRFSSEGSVTDAKELAGRLGCRFDVIGVDEIFAASLAALEGPFAGTEFGVAEENLQARIRGAVLMALSNKHGAMVVATGNKSEMAVGYATLYGDMVGGYAVLKDVFKTEVYRLAEWRNRDGEVIPRAIIEKPPSAELRPDQLDTDSLPPYDVLDAILERYVEGDQAVAEIVAAGHDPDVVARVAAMVDRNEYKRRQAAPGVKVTRKAFGRDRRLPITNRYRSS